MKVNAFYLNNLIDDLMEYGIKQKGIAKLTGLTEKQIKDIRRNYKVDVEIHKQILDNLNNNIPYVMGIIRRDDSNE